MIPFGLKVAVFRMVMAVLKWLVKMVPFPQPTLFQGPGSSLQMCDHIALMGIRKVMIVTDAMLVKLGLLKDMQQRLQAAGVEVLIFDGVKPDPTIEQIEAGLKMLNDQNCQAILAVGGGSSIDAAKVIAARATHPKKAVRKMDGMFKLRGPIFPLYAVPTTAGTGSEVTIAAVVSDPDNHRKSAIMDPKLVPSLAALDGALMTGLPAPITAATGMDALTHAVEAYISANALPDTDAQALAATRLIMENLPKVMDNGGDVEARQKMAMASFLAALAFTRAGVGYVHAISHNLGAYYHTPHGLANAIVLPYVLDYSKPECSARLAELARASGLEGGSDAELADKFIAHIRALNQKFGIPEKHAELKAEDIPAIAKAALKEAHWTYAVPRYMDKRTCQEFIRGLMA